LSRRGCRCCGALCGLATHRTDHHWRLCCAFARRPVLDAAAGLTFHAQSRCPKENVTEHNWAGASAPLGLPCRHAACLSVPTLQAASSERDVQHATLSHAFRSHPPFCQQLTTAAFCGMVSTAVRRDVLESPGTTRAGWTAPGRHGYLPGRDRAQRWETGA